MYLVFFFFKLLTFPKHTVHELYFYSWWFPRVYYYYALFDALYFTISFYNSFSQHTLILHCFGRRRKQKYAHTL